MIHDLYYMLQYNIATDESNKINSRLLVSVVAYTCPLTLVLRGKVVEICPRELKKTS